MSIQNLFSPNDFNLFANSITLGDQPLVLFVAQLSGPWAAPQNCNVYIQKHGKVVTLFFSQSIVAAATSSSAIISNNQLAAAYFPYGGGITVQLISIEDNSALTTGYISISNTGDLTIKLSNNSNFTNAGNCGFFPFCITYIGA
jgi:hypothetical protein